MNEINYVPLYSYNVSLNNKNDKTNLKNCYSNIRSDYSTDYMSSDVSSASRAYGLSFVNKNKTIPQMSLKNMITWLEAQGKVEGKDFKIDSSCTMGNTLLILNNKQGQEELAIHYDNGNYNSWNCYEVSEYKNGKLYKRTDRDYNGDVSSYLQVFDKNDLAVQHLLEEPLTYDTTPQQYEKYLKDNNIDYKIEYAQNEANNRRDVYIDVIDKNKQIIKKISYYYGENKFGEQCHSVSQSDINEKGEEYRRLTFNKDNVDVITYVRTVAH